MRHAFLGGAILAATLAAYGQLIVISGPPKPPLAGAGVTVAAASCSRADVSASLSAATAGDTVTIPAGTCAWTSGITWTAPANVIVKGAGSLSTTGGGDVTVIVDDFDSTTPLIAITTVAGTFRLAGITFAGGSSDEVKANGLLQIGGASASMRLDHLHFDLEAYTTDNATKWLDAIGVFGVIDHIIVETVFQSVSHFNQTDYGGSTNGDGTWAVGPGFGGAEFVYIEDSEFYGIEEPTSHLYLSTVTDSSAGGKFVARFNTIVGSGFVSNHPTGGGGRGRGGRAYEAYGNLASPAAAFNPLADNPPYTFAWSSSGGGPMVWGNTTTGAYKNFIYLDSMRKSNATYAQSATPTGWGYCGTEFNGTGSAWDQNTVAANGARCLDQPGSGQGDLLSGNFPNAINTTTGTIAWPNQVLEPVYEWMNSFDAVSGWGNDADNHFSIPSGAETRLIENRDYYKQASGVQTTSSSPFDGTVGVGWGTLARRPATCTAGVGYFASDQGSWNTSSSNPAGVQMNGADGLFYQCSATNTWTLYYTPYTYPHPLNQ